MKDPLEPDEELLEHARQSPEGDYQAFERLVHRYQKQVVTNCRCLTRSAACAEDLAQEVFVKIFFAMGRFEGRSSFHTWMQRIKVNHCLNFLKRQGGKTFLDVEDENVMHARQLTVESSAEKVVMSHDEREQIAAILDAMPDSLRIPLLMRDMDQLSYEEVAETLGIGLSAVKMRIKRGREEFRRRYRELSGEMETLTGFYARKFLQVGKSLEVLGQQGILRAITATHTILEREECNVSVSNASFLDNVARQ